MPFSIRTPWLYYFSSQTIAMTFSTHGRNVCNGNSQIRSTGEKHQHVSRNIFWPLCSYKSAAGNNFPINEIILTNGKRFTGFPNWSWYKFQLQISFLDAELNDRVVAPLKVT